MKNQIDAVKLFNKCLDRKTEAEGNSNIALAIKLVDEEFGELKTAILEKDRVGQLDGLADSLYVLFGLAEFLGLDEVLPEAFDRVHASNMTKFCKDLVEVSETMSAYKDNGIETDYNLVNLRIDGKKTQLYVVYRKSDGKGLKKLGYQAVKLDDLV